MNSSALIAIVAIIVPLCGVIVALLFSNRRLKEKAGSATAAVFPSQCLLQLAQAIPSAFFMIDEKNLIVAISQKAEVLTGYKAAEVIGRNIRDVLPGSIPSDETPTDVEILSKSGEGFIVNCSTKECNASFGKVQLLHFSEKSVSVEEDEQRPTTFDLLLRVYNSPYSSFWGSDTFNKKMIYVSPGTELVYGHHPEEFLSNPNLWFEVILAEDRHIVERAYPDMQAGKIVELEYRINHSKRGIVWVEARMLPTIDSQGRFVRLDGVTVDITSRKQVELNLQEHEKNLKEAQRIASIGSWQLDHVTGKMKLSEEIERIFEFNTNEIEPNFPHFISFIHPEDVQMVVEGFEKSIKEKTSFDLMYRIQLPDTRVKYMQSRGETVFDIDGRPMQSIGTTQDMTILRMAEMALADREARLETIYQNGPDSIKLTNRNNELLEMNPAGLKMIEADSLEQVQGKSLLEIVNEPFKKRYAEVTEEIYSGKTAIFQYQVTTLKGNLRWFESHSVPMRDTNGKIIAMLCVTHDITEKKQADENLRISNAEFRQLAAHIEKIREEERMNLSREIHDELGQKLTALKMDAKWIGKRMSAADKEVEERFNSFSQMLDSMVKNVRKIASELRPSELEHLGLQPTLELYAQDFERRTGMKVSFQADISAFTSTPEISISLFRIFQESLTNIARHSGATEVNILVSIEEGDNFIMKIHDNGIGYNETQVKTRKTLGLLGMRERARLHGGDYLIRSIPGFGTQIEVSIPLGKSGAVVQSETT